MEYYQTDNYDLNSKLSDNNLGNIESQKTSSNTLHGELSPIIQNFNKIDMKEIEPSIQNINENIFEEYLSIVVDELVNLILKDLNKGFEEYVIKKHTLNYINNCKIKLQVINNWLLNNQINSNPIYLFGYFNYHGIGINVNKQKATELILKAADLENNVAQLDIAKMYIDGNGVDKNHDIAFELSKKLSENPNAINRLGYCFELGIGTNINMEKACELYQKAANLGNIKALRNLALMYKYGKGVEVNYDMTFKLLKKLEGEEYPVGINLLGQCYYNGTGTDVNKQKALELYQKAENLEKKITQYNLANKYGEDLVE